MRYEDGIAVFGKHDAQTLAQLRDVAHRAEKAALMADGHIGYIMPIGGVAAYQGKVSVAGVGFDIACGNAAIRTDLKLADIQPHLEKLADEIASGISFGVGRSNRADDAVILQGTPQADIETRTMQEAAMFSTVHGAGRVVSRRKALGKVNRKTGQVLHTLKPLIVVMAGADEFDPYKD